MKLNENRWVCESKTSHDILVVEADFEHTKHENEVYTCETDTSYDVHMGNMAELMVYNGNYLLWGIFMLLNESVKKNNFAEPGESGNKGIWVWASLASINHFDLSNWNVYLLWFI